MDAEEFLDTFIRDAEEHLRSMRREILALEKEGYRPQGAQEVMRRAHNLKGSARVFGLEDIGRLAHALEDLVAGLETGEQPLSAELIDRLLKATDELEARIRQAQDSGEILQNLTTILTGIGQPGPAGARRPPSGRETRAEAETVRTSTTRLDQLANLLGELLAARSRFADRGRQLAGLIDEFEGFLKGLRKHPQYPAGKELLNHLVGMHLELDGEVTGFHQLAEELRAQALVLRMRPLSSITEGFPRLVRDLAREQHKQAELVLNVGEVEVDRTLLEALKPMLVHMLRNAVDHGVEAPEERNRSGKKAEGRIELSARYQGGMILVCLRDDGRGIEPGLVRQVAVQRGLVSESEAEALSDEEALYLIMRPGFSTREIITDVSGRGVGMDVVKSGIDQIRGDLTIRSDPGRGTEIQLRLPLTLAVVAGLVVDCEGETYALPLHYVAEITRLREADLQTEGGREVIRFQGKVIPLFALREALQLPSRQHESLVRQATAVVLNFGGQHLACLVSGTRGTRELLVRKLGDQLRRLRFFSGATLLGDGTPALMLSVPDLYASRLEAGATTLRRELAAQRQNAVRGRVLVVDDSITTRTMEKNILETHQYEVEVAISGTDALAKAALSDFDLVVTDIEMPGMDGFELTRELRKQQRTAQVPVVIVSSRASDEDRRRGIEVGAQAYIVKSSFDQGKLLDTVDALIG